MATVSQFIRSLSVASPSVPWSIWIGFDSDPRQAIAYAVARDSIKANCSFKGIPTYGLVLDKLKADGLYTRPTEKRLGKLWDTISGAPMSTEFAISRFLVPQLAKRGWAIFMDCDVMVRGNLARLFETFDSRYAVYCVKHDNYAPAEGVKMDGQEQTAYPRKNWSSVMAFNCDHPSNKKLTVNYVNMRTGRDLHRFCWLQNDEIGELPKEWNWLVGEQPEPENPMIVHYTCGGPWFNAFADAPRADEWRGYLQRWAS